MVPVRSGSSYLSVKVKSPSFKAGTFFRGFTWAKASLRCWPAESASCWVRELPLILRGLCSLPTMPRPQRHGSSPALSCSPAWPRLVRVTLGGARDCYARCCKMNLYSPCQVPLCTVSNHGPRRRIWCFRWAFLHTPPTILTPSPAS